MVPYKELQISINLTIPIDQHEFPHISLHCSGIFWIPNILRFMIGMSMAIFVVDLHVCFPLNLPCPALPDPWPEAVATWHESFVA